MRFRIDIDRVVDGRPEGRIREETEELDRSFEGWVDLLRLMERRCGTGAVLARDTDDAAAEGRS